MLAPPDDALEIASSARMSDSSFVAGTRRFASDIRVVFKAAMFLMRLAENVLQSNHRQRGCGRRCLEAGPLPTVRLGVERSRRSETSMRMAPALSINECSVYPVGRAGGKHEVSRAAIRQPGDRDERGSGGHL